MKNLIFFVLAIVDYSDSIAQNNRFFTHSPTPIDIQHCLIVPELKESSLVDVRSLLFWKHKVQDVLKLNNRNGKAEFFESMVLRRPLENSSTWIDDYGIKYGYTADEQLSYIEYYRIDLQGVHEPQGRDRFIYDDRQNLIEYSLDDWDADAKIWLFDGRVTYIYDDYDQLIEKSTSFWDNNTSVWQVYLKSIGIYSTDHLLTEEIHSMWVADFEQFWERSKINYIYDFQGDLITEIRYVKDDIPAE